MPRILYRIVKHKPPVLADFASYRSLGLGTLRDDPEMRRLAEGLSVYATLAQARRAARAQPYLGRFVAEIVIDDEAHLTCERTGRKPGHHTIWCVPPEMLPTEVMRRVRAVVAV